VQKDCVDCYDAVNEILDKASQTRLPGCRFRVVAAARREFAKRRCCDAKLIDPIEKTLEECLKRWTAGQKRSIWESTETGAGEDSDSYDPDGIDMALEGELMHLIIEELSPPRRRGESPRKSTAILCWCAAMHLSRTRWTERRSRAMEALKDVPVPVYLLPGNHDPLNATSVYRSSIFIERKPDHVHVIENANPIQVSNGIEIVGAPWLSRRPAANPIGEALNALPMADGIKRICAGHGVVDLLTPDSDAPGIIEVAAMEYWNRGRTWANGAGMRVHCPGKVQERA
jgi:hypothetical protein